MGWRGVCYVEVVVLIRESGVEAATTPRLQVPSGSNNISLAGSIKELSRERERVLEGKIGYNRKLAQLMMTRTHHEVTWVGALRK